MSFNNNQNGKSFEPGWFLANNEDCTRETREISQSGAKTSADGGKYVEMGTVYPSNDGNAIGIVYEDVDVTSGNMPGSVVTKGEVYEDRLAITGQTYGSATVTSADNPSTKGWHEKNGDEYSASEDTVASRDKDYYTRSGSSPDYTYTKVTTIEYGDNPAALGLYERSGSSPNYVYTLSTDTQAAGSKTYYKVTGVTRLSDAAKTALEGLGFKFKTVPTVTR